MRQWNLPTTVHGDAGSPSAVADSREKAAQGMSRACPRLCSRNDRLSGIVRSLARLQFLRVAKIVEFLHQRLLPIIRGDFDVTLFLESLAEFVEREAVR